jgi:hypothetical protein
MPRRSPTATDYIVIYCFILNDLFKGRFNLNQMYKVLEEVLDAKLKEVMYVLSFTIVSVLPTAERKTITELFKQDKSWRHVVARVFGVLQGFIAAKNNDRRPLAKTMPRHMMTLFKRIMPSRIAPAKVPAQLIKFAELQAEAHAVTAVLAKYPFAAIDMSDMAGVFHRLHELTEMAAILAELFDMTLMTPSHIVGFVMALRLRIQLDTFDNVEANCLVRQHEFRASIEAEVRAKVVAEVVADVVAEVANETADAEREALRIAAEAQYELERQQYLEGEARRKEFEAEQYREQYREHMTQLEIDEVLGAIAIEHATNLAGEEWLCYEHEAQQAANGDPTALAIVCDDPEHGNDWTEAEAQYHEYAELENEDKMFQAEVDEFLAEQNVAACNPEFLADEERWQFMCLVEATA